jgi:DNA polymerase-1
MKNKKPILLLDCNALAHRSWYVLQDLVYKGKGTGVLFGVLRDLVMVQEQFDTPDLVFCFDHGESKRKLIYPQYKANRTKEGKQSLYYQIDLLKHEVLPAIGFNNIYFVEGYEADDWLAFLSTVRPTDRRSIIVTRDHDMHQLLTEDDRVEIWDPQLKAYYTYEDVLKAWDGVTPEELPYVMAYMGCKTDNIEGVKGVGPITAIKLFREEGVLPRLQALAEKFRNDGHYLRNLKLIKLPLEGLEDMGFRPHRRDNVSQVRWNAVCEKYGLVNLVPKCPMLSPPDDPIPDKRAGPSLEAQQSWKGW